MAGSKRAFGLATASAAVILIVSWPASPVSATDSAAVEVSLPPAAAPLIEAEPVDHEEPLAGESMEAVDVDLESLVSAVGDMHGVVLDDDMRCLASAVYYEARGESIEGQLAVAQVVLNRAAKRRSPGELCRVVYQRGQFSFTFDGQPDTPASRNANWRRAEAVAIIAATGNWRDVTDSALYFHATYVSPGWRRAKEQTRRIGRHIFYR